MASSMPLMKIPWHIQHEVFKYMDPISRISMRKCSKRVRQIVNECEVSYKYIHLQFDKDLVRMKLITDSGQEAVVNYRREAVDNEENCVSGEDYIQRIAIDFSGIVANPRVTVDLLTVGRRFEFRTYPDEEFQRDVRVLIQCIGEQMNVLGEQMKVKSLISLIEVPQDEMMTLLSVMKPGILEYICFRRRFEENLDCVTTTEQWNRARKVYMIHFQSNLPLLPIINNSHKVPIEKLLHFRKVTIRCRWLTIEEAEKIVEAAIRQGDEFIYFRIDRCFTTQTNRDLIQQLINRQNPDCQLKFLINKTQFHVDRKQYVGN